MPVRPARGTLIGDGAGREELSLEVGLIFHPEILETSGRGAKLLFFLGFIIWFE
jgi:hypothetical protein